MTDRNRKLVPDNWTLVKKKRGKKRVHETLLVRMVF